MIFHHCRHCLLIEGMIRSWQQNQQQQLPRRSRKATLAAGLLLCKHAFTPGQHDLERAGSSLHSSMHDSLEDHYDYCSKELPAHDEWLRCCYTMIMFACDQPSSVHADQPLSNKKVSVTYQHLPTALNGARDLHASTLACAPSALLQSAPRGSTERLQRWVPGWRRTPDQGRFTSG